KEAEEIIQRALDDAQAAARAKDQFLAILSHELRTPLTPISMAVAAMQADRKLPERFRRILQMVQRNIQLEAQLIDDLLDLSRIIHRKVEFNLEEIDLHHSIQRAVEICQADMTAKD